MYKAVKLTLFVLSWALAFPILVFKSEASWLITLALLSYASLLLVIMMRMSRHVMVIILILLFVGWLVLGRVPHFDEWRGAGLFVLIFAAIIPTQAMMRAVAMTMPSVARTQEELGALPPANTASGLQLVSHFLGGVINTGTFPLIAASQPQNAKQDRRLIAALASLRGMNSSVLWSPFFVSFAVALTYLPQQAAWGAIGLGIITATLFGFGSMLAFAERGKGIDLMRSVAPLRPIAGRFAIIFGSVLLVSALTGLTALHAVVATIPLLVMVQLMRRPDTAKPIIGHFTRFLGSSGDELLIISTSMIIAGLAGQSEILAGFFTALFGDDIPAALVIFALPVIVWLASLAGIHPVISSTPILALCAPSLSLFESVLMMQAHMMGWCAGTMNSVSSLSVLTVAEQFKIDEVKLAFSRNLYVSGGLAVAGGGALAAIQLIF